jgi:hypothetical protein
MKLSEVPFNKIKDGMRVISDNTKVRGKVVKNSQADANDREGDFVRIRWDNGKESYDSHFWMDKISVEDK